jgi:hypothetical protein
MPLSVPVFRNKDCMIRVSVLSPGFKSHEKQTLDDPIWIANRAKLISVYPCLGESVSSIITYHIQSAVDDRSTFPSFKARLYQSEFPGPWSPALNAQSRRD